nr:radical SAM protein [uncultured Carboxylicivirga sp.]
MGEYYIWLNTLVNKCKSDYSAWPELKWLNPYEALETLELRASLIDQANKSSLFKQTKPYHKQISKGCQICGEGSWSCLFITNQCNAGCFYCPVSQKQDETPGTQGLDFNTPVEFANYVNRLKFKGVSFSGGEPLLYFDRTLAYLNEVRKKCDKDLYVWAYTNGILADREKMDLLAKAGLNEIRFDIGATGFKLDKIAFAKGLIPNISIEIPAVPEEKERLKELLPQMIEAGVTNLNLHQLRLTLHNVKHLSKRDYTYIPAERPIVFESELAALEIIQYARENDLNIGINYCSFFYKHRFQKAGYRRQLAQALKINSSEITENGYIRHLTDNNLEYRSVKLFEEQPESLETQPMVIADKTYFIANPLILKERISDEEKEMITRLITQKPATIPSDDLLFKVWQMEYIEEGLREY